MDKGLADPADKNESDLAASDFLVLPHVRYQAVGIPEPFRKGFKSSWKTDQRQVAADAVCILHRTKSELHGQIEGEAEPDRHRLAMQHLVAIAALGLKGVRKCVPKIEQRALAALA